MYFFFKKQNYPVSLKNRQDAYKKVSYRIVTVKQKLKRQKCYEA